MKARRRSDLFSDATQACPLMNWIVGRMTPTLRNPQDNETGTRNFFGFVVKLGTRVSRINAEFSYDNTSAKTTSVFQN